MMDLSFHKLRINIERITERGSFLLLTCDENSTEEQHEPSDAVQSESTTEIGEQNHDSFACRCAELLSRHCDHDVGVLVDETQTLLQAPETTLETAQNELGDLVVPS